MNIVESKKSKGMTIETVTVLLVTILLFILFEKYRSVLTALPVLYLVIERRFRDRTWSSLGFKFKNIGEDIKSVWIWLLIVIFISPIMTLLIANRFLPEFIVHVKDRLPMDINSLIPTLVVITIGTFLEEIIFRGFVQERLSWFTGSAISIIVASILFALMHYASGDTKIVTYDMVTILIDSIIYGIIFLKTKNLFVSWIGHYLCDIVAIGAIWLMY
jgi:membrane protease YdiL (CAAX protease family)